MSEDKRPMTSYLRASNKNGSNWGAGWKHVDATHLGDKYQKFKCLLALVKLNISNTQNHNCIVRGYNTWLLKICFSPVVCRKQSWSKYTWTWECRTNLQLPRYKRALSWRAEQWRSTVWGCTGRDRLQREERVSVSSTQRNKNKPYTKFLQWASQLNWMCALTSV